MTLEEQLAAMTAERDRLQTIDLDLQMAVQKLTASQAYAQQLREALKTCQAYLVGSDQWTITAYHLATEALALPQPSGQAVGKEINSPEDDIERARRMV